MIFHFVKALKLIPQLFLISIVYFHQDFKMNLNLKILLIRISNLKLLVKNKRINNKLNNFK